jgi:hypothetical protein
MILLRLSYSSSANVYFLCVHTSISYFEEGFLAKDKYSSKAGHHSIHHLLFILFPPGDLDSCRTSIYQVSLPYQAQFLDAARRPSYYVRISYSTSSPRMRLRGLFGKSEHGSSVDFHSSSFRPLCFAYPGNGSLQSTRELHRPHRSYTTEETLGHIQS